MELTFKRATEKDWKTVSFLEKRAAGAYYSAITKEDEIKKYIRNSRVFLIMMGDKVVGTTSYEVKDKNHAYMDGLTVHPDHQKQGIGTKAMEFLMNELKGFKKITFVVHPRNIPAMRLYLKFGFYFEGWKENYYGDGEPRLLMVKEQK